VVVAIIQVKLFEDRSRERFQTNVVRTWVSRS